MLMPVLLQLQLESLAAHLAHLHILYLYIAHAHSSLKNSLVLVSLDRVHFVLSDQSIFSTYLAYSYMAFYKPPL